MASLPCPTQTRPPQAARPAGLPPVRRTRPHSDPARPASDNDTCLDPPALAVEAKQCSRLVHTDPQRSRPNGCPARRRSRLDDEGFRRDWRLGAPPLAVGASSAASTRRTSRVRMASASTAEHGFRFPKMLDRRCTAGGMTTTTLRPDRHLSRISAPRRKYAHASRGCEHFACRRPQSGQYSRILALPAS